VREICEPEIENENELLDGICATALSFEINALIVELGVDVAILMLLSK
jgi:hypothetical protein